MKITKFFILSSFFLWVSCNSEHSKNQEEQNPKTYQIGATLWYQNAAEVKALYHQAYNMATWQLQQYLNAPTSSKKPCVVVDVDETVLNNSNHQAWLIKNAKNFPEGWFDWTLKAEAKALPGALEFLQFAAQNEVEVFYITNRGEKEKMATLKNLKNLNFPFADTSHILVKETTSSKVERRNKVLANYEIVLFAGDNLSDFDDFHKLSTQDRHQKTESLKHLFGKKFIVLPNPMYGDWEGAIYNYNYQQPDSAKHQIQLNSLEAF